MYRRLNVGMNTSYAKIKYHPYAIQTRSKDLRYRPICKTQRAYECLKSKLHGYIQFSKDTQQSSFSINIAERGRERENACSLRYFEDCKSFV